MVVVLLALQREPAPFPTVLAGKMRIGVDFIDGRYTKTDYSPLGKRLEWLLEAEPDFDLLPLFAAVLASTWCMAWGLAYSGPNRAITVAGRVLATAVFGVFLALCAAASFLSLFSALSTGNEEWMMGVSWAFIVLPTLAGCGFLVREFLRGPARGLTSQITMLAVVASISALGITGTASLRTDTAGWLDLLDLSFTFGLVSAVWTFGLLVYLSRRPALQLPGAPPKPGNGSDGAYIRSARQISLVLFGLVAVDTQVAFGLKSAAEPLLDARKIYADHVFAQTLSQIADAMEGAEAETRGSEITEAAQSLSQYLDSKQDPVTLTTREDNLRLGDRSLEMKWARTKRGWSVNMKLRVESATGALWSNERYMSRHSNEVLAMLRGTEAFLARDATMDDLIRAGRRLGADIGSSDRDDFDDAFYQIESRFAKTEVAVPVLGLALSPAFASPMVLVLVLGALVVLRSRIDAALEMGGPSRGEPWLVLDARRGLARAGALFWIVGIVVAPILALACSIEVAATMNEITGESSEAAIAGTVVSHLVAWPLAAWVSLTACAGVLRLRRYRLGERDGG
jgi:hypothetical protein